MHVFPSSIHPCPGLSCARAVLPVLLPAARPPALLAVHQDGQGHHHLRQQRAQVLRVHGRLGGEVLLVKKNYPGSRNFS